MKKKHFIALADYIKRADYLLNGVPRQERLFTEAVLGGLGDFCVSQNPRFNRKRWFDYIAGKCGPNGGQVK